MSAEEADVNFNAPIKSVSIENMVRVRAGVIERIEQAVALLHQAHDMAASAHIGWPRIDIESTGRCGGAPLLSPHGLPTMRQAIDRVAWGYLMKESGLRTFMDASARKEWDASLHDKEDVPELTMENVKATFQTMYNARGEMFERGVIRCFKSLSWDYKTNQPFRFGKRIIMNRMMDVWGSKPKYISASHTGSDQLDDLLRVFHVLDDKPEPDHRNGMYYQIGKARSANAMSCDGEYFDLKWFLKGSGHVTFKRLDLVDQLNAIIAKHFPGALPDGRRG